MNNYSKVITIETFINNKPFLYFMEETKIPYTELIAWLNQVKEQIEEKYNCSYERDSDIGIKVDISKFPLEESYLKSVVLEDDDLENLEKRIYKFNNKNVKEGSIIIPVDKTAEGIINKGGLTNRGLTYVGTLKRKNYPGNPVLDTFDYTQNNSKNAINKYILLEGYGYVSKEFSNKDIISLKNNESVSPDAKKWHKGSETVRVYLGN